LVIKEGSRVWCGRDRVIGWERKRFIGWSVNVSTSFGWFKGGHMLDRDFGVVHGIKVILEC